MTKKLFISLVLCMSLLGAASPALAQVDQKSGEDTLAQLQREGWKIVKDGVLQRELVPGEVESFVFGVPGFVWKIQDLQKQLRKLQAEFRANPTSELRKAIANHRKAIANSRRALAIAQTAEDRGEEIDQSKVNCAINFSYDATATSKTDVQGVLANASATFAANCGFTGQVYTYAFAKTWVNGSESTDTVTDGPRSGANVSATAYASRIGGAPCESNAYGEMVSYGLNPSSWSKQVTNYNCPSLAPPLNVTVTSNAPSTTIDLYNSDCINITWTTNISGGTPSYTSTMYVNGVSQGTRTTYTGTYCNAGTNSSSTVAVSSTVTDSGSPVQSKSASAPTITIRSHVVAPPLNVTVTSNAPSTTIDLYNSDCINITWTTNISGGTPSYTSTMYVNGASQGTGTTYTGTYCNAGTNSSSTVAVSSTVTDSGSPVQSKSASAPTITIRSHVVVQPLNVTVTSNQASTIELYGNDCVAITWTTNISGGSSPFTTTMYLNNVSQGVRTTYSETICNRQYTSTQTITIRSDVTDSASQSGSGSYTTTIRHHDYNPDPPCYSTALPSDGKAAPLPPPCY